MTPRLIIVTVNALQNDAINVNLTDIVAPGIGAIGKQNNLNFEY